MLNTIRKFTAIAILVGAAIGTVPAHYGLGNYDEAEARREREIQACMRPALLAYQQAIKEAQQNLKKAQVEAERDFDQAMRNNKSDAARTAAKKAKQEAIRKAQQEATQARRAAGLDKQKAEQDCRNPKPNNDSSDNNSNKTPDSNDRSCVAINSTEKTLGRGPRGRNSVRMDLRVVDETGKPVAGVKTKLWSERQSNGMLCETIHTTNACGTVLMDPIHFNKTLQLKLEAKGYKPQMVQVEPSQLDRPFRAVMQAR